jgi:eukaryotic-like serine/threonine-protein kinase
MSADWDALRELFDGALERPVHERAAYLSERTQGNDALRREIESLLAAHGDADQFLSAAAFRPSSRSSSQAVATHGGASTRLTAGTRLGAFEILALLGTGGMGEVYRARDTRLDRFVAIKVLSTEIDLAPRGRERFEREARAISKLSHPRICTVHDIGVAEIDGRDVPYLVMELLDGETLATRIARGPLPVDQALSYGIDVADALVMAHGQGIVHRDLKPANVIVTSTGVKLLDFGLAQLRKPDGAIAHGAAPSADATLTSAGMVFGTLPYMSPEQLRGERVDTRSDVFAFGALLHEMLTGRRPFHADSEAGLIAAILEHQAPAVSDLQPLASSGLDRIVRKCLAKDPDDRWQTARDLKSDLIWVREEREESARARTPLPTTSHRRRWQQVLVTGIPTIAAVLLAVMVWRTAAPPVRGVTRLALNLPPGVTLDIPVNGISFAIAPDGSRIAFLGMRDARQSLFIHTLESGKTVDVPDTRDAFNPTFSPDSQGWRSHTERPACGRCRRPAGRSSWSGQERPVS